MKIRTRLISTFAVLAAMVVFVAIVSLKSTADANQNFSRYIHVSAPISISTHRSKVVGFSQQSSE
jgi:CHASE3 domain sensor protein